MNNLLGKLDQHMPSVYGPLAKLKISTGEELSSSACNLVPVAKNNGDLKYLSDDAQGLSKLLDEELTQLGWQFGDKPIRLRLDGKLMLIVGVPSVKVNKVQISRQLGFDVADALKKSKNKNIKISNMSEGLEVESVLEGYCLGLDDKAAFKSKVDTHYPDEVIVPAKSLEKAEVAKNFARSIIFTKWLQDAPSNFMNPELLAEIAQTMFSAKGEVKVLGRKEMEELGMGSFLSVARGATVDPKLVSICFKGKDPSKTVALVGKGVTFDSGGINIKPSAGMEEMKYDMSGAAAVYGAAHFFADHQPPVNVVCAIGATENMPSGDATRPGDIVKSLSGKTIEILNTDAEGRLVLADVLTHVINEHKPNMVLDIATLTGAVLFGLGHAGAGFMTPDDSTSDFLSKVSQNLGESLWRLPLWPELESEVSSEIADLKNLPAGSVKAGTIMGGWFLHEFVKDASCKWAHIDIAGTAWNCSATGYHKSGGSGFGVRTMVGACMNFEA